MPSRTSRELIELYWEEVWNRGHVELIREICTDPLVRHDPDSTTPLSHEQQIERVRREVTQRKPFFTHEVLVADDNHVVSVWNATLGGASGPKLCGIEVFRVTDGRLSDAWNSTYTPGHWGRADQAQQVFDAPDVLAQITEIDTNWIRKVFAVAGLPAGDIGHAFPPEPVGHGTTGAKTVRVVLSCNGPASALPESVICKFSSPDAPPFVKELKMFEREVSAYQLFSDGFRHPTVYFAESQHGIANLVLEDLSDAEPGTQSEGATAEQAHAAVRELARLHKRYWADARLADLNWALDRSQTAEGWTQVYHQGLSLLEQRLGEILTVDERSIATRFGSLIEPWMRYAGRGRTLLHGEPRIDNFLFERSADGALSACLIDFQLVTVGDPQLDVGYFIAGSLPTESRRAMERELVQMHVDIIDAGFDYSFEHAFEQYRIGAAYALLTAVTSIPTIADTAHNRAMMTALLRRSVAAVSDLRTIEAIRAAVTEKAR